MDYLKLIQLFQGLDPETTGLFTQFAIEAGRDPDGVNAYVKRKLRAALAPEPPAPPPKVEVKVTGGDRGPFGRGDEGPKPGRGTVRRTR